MKYSENTNDIHSHISYIPFVQQLTGREAETSQTRSALPKQLEVTHTGYTSKWRCHD